MLASLSDLSGAFFNLGSLALRRTNPPGFLPAPHRPGAAASCGAPSCPGSPWPGPPGPQNPSSGRSGHARELQQGLALQGCATRGETEAGTRGTAALPHLSPSGAGETPFSQLFWGVFPGGFVGLGCCPRQQQQHRAMPLVWDGHKIPSCPSCRSRSRLCFTSRCHWKFTLQMGL